MADSGRVKTTENLFRLWRQVMSQQEAQLSTVSNDVLCDSDTKKAYTWNSYVSDYEGFCIPRYAAVSSGN